MVDIAAVNLEIKNNPNKIYFWSYNQKDCKLSGKEIIEGKTYPDRQIDVYHFQHPEWNAGITMFIYNNDIVGHIVWRSRSVSGFYKRGSGDILVSFLKMNNIYINISDRGSYNKSGELYSLFKTLYETTKPDDIVEMYFD